MPRRRSSGSACWSVMALAGRQAGRRSRTMARQPVPRPSPAGSPCRRRAGCCRHRHRRGWRTRALPGPARTVVSSWRLEANPGRCGQCLVSWCTAASVSTTRRQSLLSLGWWPWRNGWTSSPETWRRPSSAGTTCGVGMPWARRCSSRSSSHSSAAAGRPDRRTTSRRPPRQARNTGLRAPPASGPANSIPDQAPNACNSGCIC
jgi:hypothetical protein